MGNYRERLIELYCKQIQATFKVSETATNFIVYRKTEGEKIIVAKLPKGQEEPLQAEHIAHYIIGYVSRRDAEKMVADMDKEAVPAVCLPVQNASEQDIPKNAPVVHVSKPVDLTKSVEFSPMSGWQNLLPEGRQATPTHPLE